MKTLLSIAIIMLALAGNAATTFTTNVVVTTTVATDTNPAPPVLSGPAWDAIQFLGSGSNWMIAPYGIFSTGSRTSGSDWVAGKHSIGAGIGVGYKVSEFVVPTMRLDYLDGELWMPSASLQLQAPIKLLNKVTLIPFVFGGLATPIAGKGKDNGTAIGIYGAGAAVRLDFISKSTSKWVPIDVIADFEKWGGFDGSQYRFGLVWKL